MAGYIPLDVIVSQIFPRLPLRSLGNCICVCKEWLRILSGSEFAKIHIQHLTKDNHHNLKFICGPLKRRDVFDLRRDIEHLKTVSACGGVFYTLDLEPPSPTLTRLPGFPVHLMSNYRLCKTLGYCNGMVCMEIHVKKDWQWPRILFGNPSTGYYKILPDPLMNGPFIVGFGYDSRADDYKFVRVDNVTRHPHVYSVKSNSWTINPGSSDEHKIVLKWRGYDQDSVLVGTFVEATIYWVVSGAEATIVGYDLNDDKFMELPLPHHSMRGVKTLKALQGSLCLINMILGSGITFDVEIWLLKEKNKWHKLVKLTEISSDEYISPLAFMNDGRVLCWVEHEPVFGFLSKSRYILIDQQTSKVEDFPVSGIRCGLLSDYIFGSQFSGYIHTLVSP